MNLKHYCIYIYYYIFIGKNLNYFTILHFRSWIKVLIYFKRFCLISFAAFSSIKFNANNFPFGERKRWRFLGTINAFA